LSKRLASGFSRIKLYPVLFWSCCLGGLTLAVVVALIVFGSFHIQRKPTTSPVAEERVPMSEVAQQQPTKPQAPEGQLITRTPVNDPKGIDEAADTIREEPDFRMCTMTEQGTTQISVGIVNKTTGYSRLLRTGDRTADGFVLEFADFERETAVFTKNGGQYTMYIEQGADITEPMLPMDKRVETRAPAHSSKETFRDMVLRTEAGDEAVLTIAAQNPEFIEIKMNGETLAIRRRIVENIISMEHVTPEEQLQMLLTYPEIALIQPGEDISERVDEVEHELAAQLIPPTNPPPLDKLEAIRAD